MTLRLQIDPGGEKYLSFAKRKLRQLKAWLLQTKQSTGRKYFKITASESVFVHTVHAGRGVFLDFIRITAGGKIIVKVGASQYAVLSWDGGLIALVADPLPSARGSNFVMHEAIGNLVLCLALAGTNAYFAYTIDAKSFTVVSGPEDYSSDGYASFSYWQPPAVGGILPPKKWAGSIAFGSSVSLSGLPIATAAQDFSAFASATGGSGATGILSPAQFQWNGNGTYLFAEIGRDNSFFTEYGMVRVVPDTAVQTAIAFTGTNTGTDSPSAFVPMCVNSTKALRPVLDGGLAYIDVRSLTDGSQLANVLLPSATEFDVLRADETRAFIIVQTAGLRKGYVLNLSTYVLTDISIKLLTWLTPTQSSFLLNSRAIILA